MATATPTEALSFEGKPAQKKLAGEIYTIMATHGRFMALDAVIRLSVDALAGALNSDATSVKAAVAANPAIFAFEERGDGTYIATTRSGGIPVAAFVDTKHSFAQRFMQPKPKSAAPAYPIRERPRVDPSWATIESVISGLDMTDEPEFESFEEQAAVETPVVAAAPPVPVVEVVEAVVVEEPEPVVARTITVPATIGTDVSGVDDIELANSIAERLRADVRVATFGDQWMIEERVPRFSRGDLRRLKDYLQEQEQPLTDDMLVQDVLGVRPGSAEFDQLRFAVNFRLSREHREFDFVGTANQRFWSTSNLPQVGTTRRKPNEIGTDYKFLQDELPESPAYRSAKSVDHVLTFYEYHLGLLPYGAELQALLPAPLLASQRSAVLTFECPQSYTTYLVELRYPTPNRGGFILGLDDFYNENLVPGAMISISRTDNDGHYTVEYLAAGNQNARLLELEDRRQRYVFRPTTYACAVDDSFLLTEEQFPKLGNEKPLDEKARRRSESIVATMFERVGTENDGHGYTATFGRLLAAVNVERPFSPTHLRQVLENDETGAFARDPDGTDAYTYVPGSPA